MRVPSSPPCVGAASARHTTPTLIAIAPSTSPRVTEPGVSRWTITSSTTRLNASAGWTTASGALASASACSGQPSSDTTPPTTQRGRWTRPIRSDGRSSSLECARRASSDCSAMPAAYRVAAPRAHRTPISKVSVAPLPHAEPAELDVAEPSVDRVAEPARLQAGDRRARRACVVQRAQEEPAREPAAARLGDGAHHEDPGVRTLADQGEARSRAAVEPCDICRRAGEPAVESTSSPLRRAGP